MKKLLFLTLTTVIVSVQASSPDTKRYEIKSGIVSYNISGGGNMMGVKNEMSGHKTLYFDDYGNIEIQETQESTKMMGHTSKNHTKTKIQNGTIYAVDFKDKMITKQNMSEMMQGKDMSKVGKEMMEQMGGKKTGKGKVLGFECEIWDYMGSKLWLYKGVLLKIESNIMGIKRTEEATEAKFNVSIPSDKLALPDYPMQSLEEMMQHKMQDSHSKDEKMQMPSPEEMQKMQEMMQNMFGGKK